MKTTAMTIYFVKVDQPAAGQAASAILSPNMRRLAPLSPIKQVIHSIYMHEKGNVKFKVPNDIKIFNWLTMDQKS